MNASSLAQIALALAALLVATLATSCGAGTGAAVSAASGGDTVTVGNAPTQISAVSVIERKVSPARIRFLLTDPEADSVTVELRATTDGTFASSTLVTTLNGLATSDAGTSHEFVWDFAPQFGNALTQDVLVFAVLQGSTNIVLGSNATFADLGNDAPVLALPGGQFLVGAGEEATGIVPVNFSVTDSSSDEVRIKVEFTTDPLAATPTWNEARPAGLPGALPTPLFAFGQVTALATGSNFTFSWDSQFDLDGIDTRVALRFVATETEAPSLDSNEEISTDFVLDNNVPPSVSIDVVGFALNPDRSRGIPVPFTIDDPEGDEVQVVFQWRDEAGTFPMLPTTLAGVQSALSDPRLRRDLQIATESPLTYEGRVAQTDGSTTAQLLELSSTHAIVNTRTPDPSDALLGMELEILRHHAIPESASPQWTSGTVGFVVGIAEGPDGTAHVLENAFTSWGLRTVDVATGGEVAVLADGESGAGIAMSVVPGSGRLIVLSQQASGFWCLTRVDPFAGTVEPLFTSDASLPPGDARGVLALRGDRALVTVGDSLVAVRFDDGTGSPGATVFYESASPLAAPQGLAADPLNLEHVYIADTGNDRIVRLDLRNQILTPLRTPAGSIQSPTALAFEHPGRRLLVLNNALPGDGSRELAAIRFGLRPAGTGNELFVRELNSIPLAACLAVGSGGLRLVGQVGGIAVGGGVLHRRRVVDYDVASKTLTVDAPFAPAIAPGARYRLVDRASLVLAGDTVQNRAFVWDSSDAPGTRDVELRAAAFDNDLGAVGSSAPKSLRSAFDTGTTAIANAGPGRPTDVDGDGDLDFVESGTTRLQTAPSSFSSIANGLTLGTNVLADVDGDGLVDVVSGNQVQLQSAAAPGTFLGAVDILPGGVFAISAGDFDSDGRLDLITLSGGIFLQTANLVFTAGPDVGVFGEKKLRDFDGDGRLDVVSVEDGSFGGSSEVVGYARSEAGTLSSGTVLASGDISGTIATADVRDLDGDGLGDAVSAQPFFGAFNLLGGLQIDLANSAPVEQIATQGATGAFDLRIADLDGDGLLDVLVNQQGSQNVVQFQSPAGVFLRSTFDPVSSLLNEVGDLDGDGRVDLIGDEVLFPRRPGAIDDPEPASFDVGFDTLTDCALGDIDGDGDIDIVAADPTISEYKLLLQDRPGIFDASVIAVPTRGGEQKPSNVFLADDTGTGANSIFSYYDLGSQTGSTYGFGDIGAVQRSVRTVDLDADGRADYLALVDIPSFSSDELKWQSRGDGEFLLATDVASFVVGDFDADGDPDIVVARSSSNAIDLLRQDGFASFTNVAITAGEPGDVAGVLDLDRDGRLDLVVTRVGQTRFYVQQPDGSFQLDSAVVPTSGAVVVEDLDRDGLVDLRYGSQVAYQVVDGVFVLDPFQPSTSSGRTADIDGDGELDAAFVNGSPVEVRFGGR